MVCVDIFSSVKEIMIANKQEVLIYEKILIFGYFCNFYV